jgi:hypothetical protein
MNVSAFSRRPPCLVIAAALQVICALSARADWPVGGTPVQPNLHDVRVQSVAGDLSGGAYVVLFYEGVATSNYAVLARVEADGSSPAGWPPFLVLGSGGAGVPDAVGRVVPDSAGWALTTGWPNWNATAWEAHIERHNATGVQTVGWSMDLSGAYQPPAFAAPVSDAAGGFFLVGRTADAIIAHHLLANGTLDPGWEPGGRVLVSQPVGSSIPQVVADGAGGILIVWTTPNSDAGRVYVLRCDANGDPVSGWPVAGRRVSTTESGQTNACFATTPSGVIIAWEDRRGADLDLYAQHVMLDGTIANGWQATGLAISAKTGDQSVPAAVSDGAGGAVLAWIDAGGLFTVRITGTGAVATGWTPGGSMVADNVLGRPQVAADRAGGAYFTWIRHLLDDVRAQHLGADGAVAPGWPTEAAELGFAADVPLIAPTGTNAAIVVWHHDGRGAAGQALDQPRGAYAQRLLPDAVVPVTASVQSVEATSERVRVVWYVDHAVAGMQVFRRTAETVWEARGTASPEGGDRLVFEDPDIVPGERYAYALGDEHVATVWVDVPTVPMFSLEGFRPNPAEGPITVAFTLDSTAPARLEIFDLAGRRVSSSEVSGPGPGRRLVAVAGGRSLPAGVYTIRLSQDGRTLSTRGAVVR